LAEALRGTDDDALAELLRLRPELISPVPGDLAQLAARAAGAPSVSRALDRLDRWGLQVLEAVCAATDPATAAEVLSLLRPAPAAAVRVALDRLIAMALVYGDDERLFVVAGAREVIGPHPAGLGPSAEVLLGWFGSGRLHTLFEDMGLAPTDDTAEAIRAYVAFFADADRAGALIARAPRAAREVLDRLTWGPPVGAVPRADRAVRAETVTSPVEWLLAHGLLVATDPGTVVLPREVSLHLRGGRAHQHVEPVAPQPSDGTVVASGRIQSTAGAQAFALLRAVEDLLDSWGLDGPPVLKAGGLGVRELKKAAAALDSDEAAAAVVLEVAFAAGLVGRSGDLDDRWLPTPGYDGWRQLDPADRWVSLADAWLRTTRVAGLVGSRDDRDKAAAPLGPDLDRTLAPEVRSAVLGVLAAAPPGTAVAADAVEAALTWQRPRRPSRLRHGLVGWTLREADQLGLTGAGAISEPGRALLATTDPDRLDRAADLLEPLLPQPLDHVLLQADLTAVAPGPLIAELAHELALAADVESTGGATVYRFSESSVRRALDAGRTAADLHAFLAGASRTPIPQPLSYLVDDIARRHGRIRVGTASAYLRCDDEQLLSELVGDRRAGELRLRRLAPTVVSAQAPVDAVLERLRAMGYAPAAEGPDGAVLIRRPDSRRAPAHQRPPRLVTEAGAPTQTLRAAAVRALRAGDRATQAPRGAVVAGMAVTSGVLPRTAASMTLAMLREALEQGRPVWIGYVDTHGSVTERVVDPVRLEGGYLTAYDHRYEEVHTFAVHRITGVAALDDEPA